MREALSLFTGSGIVDKVFQDVGFKIKGQVEIDDYCTALLERHYPDIPRARDIKTVGRKQLTRWGIGNTVDLIFGGPPCQPFSNAGKRRGKADDRHLWPQMYRLIRMLHPRVVFFENVPGIIPMVLDDILADLESEGYEAVPFVVPACAIGTSHRRDRLFIVAYAQGSIKSQQPSGDSDKTRWTSIGSSAGTSDRDNRKDIAERVLDAGRTAASGTANVVNAISPGWNAWRSQQPIRKRSATLGISGVGLADTCGPRLEVGQRIADHARQEQPTIERGSGITLSNANGEPMGRLAEPWPECGHGPTQSRLGRTTDGDTHWLDSPRWPVPPGKEQEEWEAPRTAVGIVNRTHRLKVIGNAMVPQVVYPFAQAIYEALQAEGVGNERT